MHGPDVLAQLIERAHQARSGHAGFDATFDGAFEPVFLHRPYSPNPDRNLASAAGSISGLLAGGMSNCCNNKACEIEALQRRQSAVLKVVLAVNAFMFVVEFAFGFHAGSASLVADSLDMLGDSLVYAFSLYVVAGTAAAKARSALLKGGIMAIFALAAFGQVAYKLLASSPPAAETIGLVGLLALAANGYCFSLLWRHRADDVNMSSVWLCSRNDLLANLAVVLAAIGVWLTREAWPDLLVGIGIAVLFARSSASVLKESSRELRRAKA